MVYLFFTCVTCVDHGLPVFDQCLACVTCVSSVDTAPSLELRTPAYPRKKWRRPRNKWAGDSASLTRFVTRILHSVFPGREVSHGWRYQPDLPSDSTTRCPAREIFTIPGYVLELS